MMRNRKTKPMHLPTAPEEPDGCQHCNMCCFPIHHYSYHTGWYSIDTCLYFPLVSESWETGLDLTCA